MSIYWSTGNNGSELIKFDTVTGATTVVGSFTLNGAQESGTYGLAVASDGVTAYTLMASTQTLAKVDLTTGHLTVIGTQNASFFGYALDFAPDGTLYAVNVDTDGLYKVNTTTGAFTFVENITSPVSMIMDITFDQSGHMYAVGPSDNHIYSINLATGASTLAFTTALGSLMGVATDTDGNLIATSYSSPSQFEKVNVATGTSTIVGSIGAGTSYDHGGDIQLISNHAPVILTDTTGLQGMIMQPGTYTDSSTVTGHNYFANGGAPAATFTATTLNYNLIPGDGDSSNHITTLQQFLNNGGTDGNTLSADGNLFPASTYFEMKGFFYQAAGQTYSFTLQADDGAVLYINGQQVLNDDGIHGNGAVTGGTYTATTTGYVPIEFDYFENAFGGASFHATVNGHDFSPADLVRPGTVGGAFTEAANTTGSNVAQSFSGNFAFTDQDLTDTHTVSAGSPAIAWSNGTVPASVANALTSAFSATLAQNSGANTAGLVNYTFSTPDKTFDFLSAGETLTITYTVTVADNNGGSTTQPISFTVTGTNDAPVLSAGSATVSELAGQQGSTGNDTATAVMAFTDADLNDTHTVSSAPVSFVWSSGGTLSSAVTTALNSALSVAMTTDSHGSGSGAITATFSAQDKTFDFLGAGEHITATYNVTVTDNNGATTVQPLTITINGANDAPVMTVNPELITNGDFSQGALGWSNTAPGGGVEAGGNGVGTYGTNDNTPVLELDGNGNSHDDVSQSVRTVAAGSYTLQFDVALRGGTAPASNTFQVVWNGQVIDTITPASTNMEHHSYTVTGNASTGKLDFVETGTDDSVGTIIDNVSIRANNITEKSGVTGSSAADGYSAVLPFTDVDTNDVHTISASAPTLTLVGGGSLPATLAASLTGALAVSVTDISPGTGAARFSAPDSLFDFLAAGQTLNISYDVTIDDGHGGTSTQPVAFTVTGTNDGPVLSAAAATNLTELAGAHNFASPDTADVSQTFTDPDWADTHAASVATPTAVWSGGALPSGLIAALTGGLTASVTTDSVNGGTGQLSSHFSVADSTFDFLGAGDTLTITYNVTLSDGHGGTSSQPLTFTVTGTNDAPVISADATATTIEIAGVQGSGANDTATTTVNFTDLDLNDTHMVSVSSATSISWSTGGTLPSGVASALANALSVTLAQDSTGGGTGAITANFSATDANFDFLAAGEHLSAAYNVTVSDGHGGTDTRTVTVTVNGSNDAPVITTGAASSGAISFYSADGVLTDSIGGNNVVSHGITYAPGHQGQAFDFNGTNYGTIADQIQNDFTITGWFKTSANSLTGNQFYQGNGLVYADVGGLQKDWGVSILNNHLAFGTGGNFDSTIQSTSVVNTGQWINWAVTRQGSIISIYINGHLEATEDTTYSGPLNAPTQITLGANTIDGRYYVGQLDQFTFYNRALSTAELTQGTNSALSLSVTETAGVTNSSALHTGVQSFSFTDADLDDHHSVTISDPTIVWSGGQAPAILLPQLRGALQLTSTDSTGGGTGTVTANFSAPDSTFDFLAAGETLAVTYNVTVDDGHGGTIVQAIVVNVTGTNDGPVMGAPGLAQINEASGITGSSQMDQSVTLLPFTDVDLSDHHTVTVGAPSIQVAFGNAPAGLAAQLANALAINVADSTGTGQGQVTATFSAPDSAFDFLANGLTMTVTYNVTLSDGHGGTVTQPVQILIRGTNDLPVLSADTGVHTITEQANQTNSGANDGVSFTLSYADPDFIDTHSASAALLNATWSGGASLPAGLAAVLQNALSLNTSDNGTGQGTVNASFQAADKNFDFLAAGETLTVTYTVTVDDHQGGISQQPVTITITGTNDAPVLSVPSSIGLAERAGLTGSGTLDQTTVPLTFTDVDLNDTHTVSYTLGSLNWPNGAIPAGLSTALANALTLTETDSTHTGSGGISAAFSAADSLFDFLSPGETLTVNYNVTVTDNHGGTSTKPLQFQITGANDAPVLNADASGPHNITEIANSTGNGSTNGVAANLSFTDADLSDTHTLSTSLVGVSWSGGAAIPASALTTLGAAFTTHLTDSTHSGTGSIGFNLSPTDQTFDFLAAGETLTLTYNIKVTDSHGASSTQPVTVTVTGTNDIPNITGATNFVPVGPELIVDGQFDNGPVTAWHNSGSGGAIEVNPASVYGVSPGNNAVMEIDVNGGLPVDDITQTVATTPGQVYIYQFDAAARSGFPGATNSFQVIWNGKVIDTVTPSSTTMAHFTYTFVANGPTGTVEFKELTSDGVGGIIDNVSLKAFGLALNEQGGLTGSSSPDTLSTTVSFTDADLNDTHTVSPSLAQVLWSGGGAVPAGLGAALTAAISANVATDTTGLGAGSGSVAVNFSAPDSTFDFLAAGETLTIRYIVNVDDGHGGVTPIPVEILVTGTNDGPVLSADSGPHAITELAGTGAATADTATTTLAFTDVDLNDTHTTGISAPTISWSGGATLPTGVAQALATALSTGTLDSTTHGAGHVDVTFSAPDKTFDFLAAGETLTVTYNVKVTDNHGASSTQPVTFVITGTNDTPMLSADAGSHALTELPGTGSAAADTASTTLAFTDVDLNDSHTASVAAPTITWTGGPNLPSGLAAALTGALTTAVADSTHTGAGSVTASFSAADSTFDFLAAGETLTIAYAVTVTDNNGGASTQTVTVVVTGTNDTPVLSADSGSHGVTELAGTANATADTATTTLAFTDVDLTDTHTASVAGPTIAWSGGASLPSGLAAALTGALTTSVADSTGTGSGSVTASFSAADSNFDFLAAGETLTVTYAVTVKDNNGATSTQPVTIVITGTNDTPVLSADSGSHGITELAGTGNATADTASTTLAFADVDLNDQHTASVGAPAITWSGGASLPSGLATALTGALTGALTTSVADSTGTGVGSVTASFSAADSTFDFLAAGETLTVTYAVTIKDNNGATSTQNVTVVVTGTNDTPVLTADSGPHGITEQAGTANAGSDTASTTLAFADVDLNDHHTASVGTPAIGWSGGSTLPSGLASILGGALTTSIADSTGAGAGSVTANFSAPDKAFDFLAVGETLTVTYAVTVTDNNGATSTQPVTIVITGTNDTPVLSADSGPHAITELAGTGNATADTATTTLAFTDVDLNDHHTSTVGAPAITWSGGASLPAGLAAALTGALTTTVADSSGTGSGSVTASFSAADKTFDFLAVGETLTVTYAVTVNDGHGGTSTQPVSIVVTGTNDVPVIAAGTVSTGTVNELALTTGSPAIDTATGVINFADPDLNDRPTATISGQSIAAHLAGGGSFALTAAQVAAFEADFQIAAAATNANNGAINWSFNTQDKALDFLGAGESVTLVSTVKIDDHHGGTVSQDVTVTLVGADDAPTTVGDIAGVQKNSSITVDAAHGVLSNDSDVDLHDHSMTVSAVNGQAGNVGHGLQGTYGVLTLNADGSFGYVANSKPGALPAGIIAQDTFTYTANDNHGGTTTQILTVTVYNNGTSYVQGTPGVDAVGGGNGKQVLDAGVGNHTLVGGNGPDALIAGWGNVTMTGGSGPDTFVFSHNGFGSATITDFTAGTDQLQIDHTVLASFSDVMAHATQVGANVVIAIDAADKITLQNVTLGSLHAADMVFI